MKSFCLYKLPNTADFLYVEEVQETTISIQFIDFLQETKIPFQSEPRVISVEEIKQLNITLESKPEVAEIPQTKYLENLSSLLEEMQEKEIPKVVFSRKKIIPQESNVIESYLKLAANNPTAFCYLLVENANNCWIGATPEILITCEEETFQTMSLAGTLPLQESWTAKEYEEQQLVTDYIISKLKESNLEIEVSKAEDLVNKNFKHLVSFISAKGSVSVEEILQKLHPTPAVCGIPLETAQKLIQKHENHSRELYTGFITVQSKNKTQSFVNLRCAKIYKNVVEIFVGGGILINSNPEKEFQETELKAKIIADNLVEN